MASGFVVRKNEYYDSVFLMRIAKTLDEEPGVRQSAVVMATDANKKLLANIGIAGEELEQAGPNDLVVAVLSDTPGVIERLLGNLDTRLQSTSSPARPASFSSLDAATAAHPESNLIVISVPGEYAAREARKALESEKHVFLFSNNVPLDQEVELKQMAQRRGLLVMGPDCGTSILQGVGIGFANVVRRGPVGVVGASGTGLQEFTSLIHQAGMGISHAIGTGSRDLSDEVGGITTQMGVMALEQDPETQVIVLVSKPAKPRTLARLLDCTQACQKPVVGCFLGLESRITTGGSNFTQADTIDEAVQLAIARLAQAPSYNLPTAIHPNDRVEVEASGWLPQQRYLRGLFAGGTFCYQSQQVLRSAGIAAYSNSPLDKRYRVEKPESSLEHCLIDIGDDLFTRGKPHPMIDAGQRRKRILTEAADPETAVLLLDFILGYIASSDPAGDLVDAIRQAREIVSSRGGYLPVVASICGTDRDPQNYERQKEILEQAGVLVFPSNASATRFCVKLIQTIEGVQHGA